MPSDFVCLNLRIPNDARLRQAVYGALLELTYERNWTGYEGGEDPDTIAGLMLEAFLNLEQGCSLKPGDVVLTASSTLPANRLWCDGGSYKTTSYPLLFSAIGYTFGGSGDTFFVPDFRSRLALGAGTGPGLTARTLGDVDGAESVTLTGDELPAHTHTAHAHTTTPMNGGLEAPVFIPVETPANTGSTGDGEPFDIMPPFTAVNFTIVYQ